MKTLIARILLIVILLVSLTDVCRSQIDSYTTSASTKGEQQNTDVLKNFNQKKPYYQVLNYTTYYAKKYGVPEIYLFRLLKTETGFRASDTTYNPFSRRILRTKWDGPYQMLTSTARSVWPDTLKNLTIKEFQHKMRYDMDFSVHTAVKFIHKLYKKYKNWSIVFSVYNLGPYGEHKINRYATSIVKGK